MEGGTIDDIRLKEELDADNIAYSENLESVKAENLALEELNVNPESIEQKVISLKNENR